MTRFQAVVFDLDGLLLDTEKVAIDTGMATFESLGHPIPRPVMESVIGVDTPTTLRILGDHLGPDAPTATLFAAWADAVREAYARDIPLRPRVIEALDLLDRLKMPRAVATNSETAAAEAKIERAGLGGRFNAVVGRDLAGGAKPQPHVYLTAARLLGVEPEVCLALEDSDLGVRAAKAAGMTVVQVPDLVPPHEHLADHEAPDLIAALHWAGLE